MTALLQENAARTVLDPARLAAVRGTGRLDSATEEAFDRLTRLAARLTGAPVTFISLVDADRDFYQACFGLPEPLASDRQMSGMTFCHFALVSDGPLVINDTLAHPIYRTVPTVETMGVRAYLGVPLVTGGLAIGSFCAIDFQPHVWTELDIEVLQELAASTLREIELRVAIETAQAAQRVQDDFFAAVTHELRTPMTAILGWSKLLMGENLENETANEAAEAIAGSARLQAQLIDDLLDASRIATGKIALNTSPLDANEPIRAAVRAAQPAAASSGVRLHTLYGELPPVDADPARLRQIIGNLLSNAIKFTPTGGLIDVVTTVEDGDVSIVVSDTGRGIEAALLPHIFEKHRQARAAEMGGLGLGLTIARHLVELHGGTLRAESDGAGKGARFIVCLPPSKI
ncbi:MAG: GAF domain-containing sensor histidine kinase [Acidobacteriota bacterium]